MPRSLRIRQRRSGCTTDRCRNGFTLLEVMVSLVILAMVLASVYRIAGTSIAAVSSRSESLRLALIAEAVLTAADLHRDLGDILDVVPMPPGVEIDVSWTAFPIGTFGKDTRLPEDLDQRLELVEVRVETDDGRTLQLRSVVYRQNDGDVER